MLKHGDRVGIVACSNGLTEQDKTQIEELILRLKSMGLEPAYSPYIYQNRSVFSGTAQQRADAVNSFYSDESVKAIFDVSGGDIANEVLEYLDEQIMITNPKPFFGYSDLTTVLNAIYTRTGQLSYLYQVRCLVWDEKEAQAMAFENSLFQNKDDLFDAKWRFLRGSKIDGIVVGGNIRCFLKLAGTAYMPDLLGKVLFLESYGGGVAQMATYISQLKQIGAFNQISGLLLGTFTKMEEKNETPDIEELILSACADYRFPIARTKDIGHASTSKCLIIGKHYKLETNN